MVGEKLMDKFHSFLTFGRIILRTCSMVCPRGTLEDWASVVHSGNLVSNAPFIGFFQFPGSFSVTLIGASWNHLQRKMIIPESSSGKVQLRPFRLILLMWLFFTAFLQILLWSGVRNSSIFFWFNNIYGTLNMYETLYSGLYRDLKIEWHSTLPLGIVLWK